MMMEKMRAMKTSTMKVSLTWNYILGVVYHVFFYIADDK